MSPANGGASPVSAALSAAGSTSYDGLTPPGLWQHFAALNRIPRPSGHEAAARWYVQKVAEATGATHEIDAKGNIVVRVPSRGLATDGPPTAVQTHLDMVCDQQPSVTHDWLHDPITPVRNGDRILAAGTTLGADNGIGVAAALNVLTTADLRHGPLELLFTVEEETAALEASHQSRQ
jgi:dipeptidase D